MWRKEQKRVIRRIILDIRILKKRRASNLYVYVVVFVENRVMEADGNLPVDCQEVFAFNFLEAWLFYEGNLLLHMWIAFNM